MKYFVFKSNLFNKKQNFLSFYFYLFIFLHQRSCQYNQTKSLSHVLHNLYQLWKILFNTDNVSIEDGLKNILKAYFDHHVQTYENVFITNFSQVCMFKTLWCSRAIRCFKKKKKCHRLTNLLTSQNPQSLTTNTFWILVMK